MSAIITRRGFLAGMLALGTAPAVVKADSLMKIVVPKREIILLSSLDILNALNSNFDGDTHSVLHRIRSSRQDEFGEAFFPTIILSPDELGVNPWKIKNIYPSKRKTK